LVANHYSLDHDSMISRSREGHLVWGRHVACWIARKATGCSFHEIARTLNLTHGAVMNGFSRVTNRRDTEPATRQQTDDLLAAFLAAMKA